MDKAIIVKNVSKKYRLYKNTKERLLDLFFPNKYGEDFYALSNVSFEANVGEVIGFVGINGSGKSTLSNIIAGIVPETSGTIKINGQVSLIAVSAGLKNELTGRDNIELKLLMLGFSKEEIQELEQEIIDFSELGRFIDQPVKSYSSGMKSRLGFAISVNIDPDIIIIDEALSVGDKAFAEKSIEKMNEFKEEGKTMIFVSHSIGQMRKFCDKILWLEFGMVKEFGDVKTVLPKYEMFLETWKKLSKKEREIYRENALKRDLKSNEQLLQEKQSVTNSNKVERLTSLVGRITPEESYIYEQPNEINSKKSSKNYRNLTYYIKKSANVDGEVFYLLSTLPSSVNGTIGWVKKSHIKAHRQILIDEDQKQFRVLGKGRAYNMPWGAKNNIVINSLKNYEGHLFDVTKTYMIGKTIWYFGKLEDQNVWIRGDRLAKIE